MERNVVLIAELQVARAHCGITQDDLIGAARQTHLDAIQARLASPRNVLRVAHVAQIPIADADPGAA